MKISHRAKWIIALVLWIPILALFGCEMLYVPLKCSYLKHRIESAETASQERAAFELAKRWGCCWEIHLESPPKTWLDARELDEVVTNSNRSLAVELEWMESKPNGVPFRAYRKLLDKNNIYVFFER